MEGNYRAILIVAALFSVCLAGCQFDSELSGNPNGRFPAHWTNIDKDDYRWPAYAYARHGMFDEAKRIVASGEDTQFHYEMGVRYYNYWKPRAANIEAGVTSKEVMQDMTRDLGNFNRNTIKKTEDAAAGGDPEAQEWVRRNPHVKPLNEAAMQMNEDNARRDREE